MKLSGMGSNEIKVMTSILKGIVSSAIRFDGLRNSGSSLRKPYPNLSHNFVLCVFNLGPCPQEQSGQPDHEVSNCALNV
eukprot:scaffold504776_cov16-Prasinocladus_malaysianus.AAC.1